MPNKQTTLYQSRLSAKHCANGKIIDTMSTAFNKETSSLEPQTVWRLPKDYSSLFNTPAHSRGFGGSDKTKIRRLTSAASFFKEGGKKEKVPIDFDQYDLVIITGILGCSQGKVAFALNEEETIVKFRVDVISHCTHMTMQLCLNHYSASFAVRKDLAVSPSFHSSFTTNSSTLLDNIAWRSPDQLDVIYSPSLQP